VVKEVTVLIPAIDELENLMWLIPEVRASLENVTHDFEIVVILSNEAPLEELNAVAQLGATPLIRFPTNSFGDAIRSGIYKYRETSKYILTMDADGSHSPLSLPRIVHAGRENDADVVIASRYTKGGSSDNALYLRVMSKILNYLFRLVIGIKVMDISTNYKLYNSRIFQGMELTCRNFDVIEEILLFVKFKSDNPLILEIPDHFHERKFGVSKRTLGPFILSYILTLIRMRIRL
jgi:dolichol-phosphate mannosyltransferase